MEKVTGSNPVGSTIFISDGLNTMQTPFFKVEDVFYVLGSGCAAVGTMIDEAVYVGDKVIIESRNGRISKSEVVTIEVNRKMVQSASKNEKAGLLLKGITGEDVIKNDVIKKI